MRWTWLLVFVSCSSALAACASAAAVTPSAPTAAPTATLPEATATAPPASPTAAGASAQVTLRIVPEESEVRFIIDEVLAGSPNTVVGTTTAVSGEIRGSFADPQGVQVGLLQVDLSTLLTDNNFRNRAIRDFILETGIESNRSPRSSAPPSTGCRIRSSSGHRMSCRSRATSRSTA